MATGPERKGKKGPVRGEKNERFSAEPRTTSGGGNLWCLARGGPLISGGSAYQENKRFQGRR